MNLRDLWAGKKTHALVILALIATVFNHVVTGGDVTDVTLWIDSLKLAMVSTFKMMFDRTS